jgi:hypothetical protein|uniref:Uncharacterized protein n=1 Tax=viral metagenome TaxID=1070528 RepID=A0A6C0ALP2_9ZZZZ
MDRNKELVELKRENEKLQKSLNSLKEQYNCLETEFVNLQTEYSENIIIQSMNEMKTRYDIMIKTTVPTYKFTLLNEKYNKLVKNYSGCSVLVDYIIKLIQKSERDIVNRKDILLKAELELITIKEILEDSIK